MLMVWLLSDMLREYAAVMVTSDNAFMKDNRALGTLMAQYVRLAESSYHFTSRLLTPNSSLTHRWTTGTAW
jgi:hypothetical protein